MEKLRTQTGLGQRTGSCRMNNYIGVLSEFYRVVLGVQLMIHSNIPSIRSLCHSSQVIRQNAIMKLQIEDSFKTSEEFFCPHSCGLGWPQKPVHVANHEVQRTDISMSFVYVYCNKSTNKLPVRMYSGKYNESTSVSNQPMDWTKFYLNSHFKKYPSPSWCGLHAEIIQYICCLIVNQTSSSATGPYDRHKPCL